MHRVVPRTKPTSCKTSPATGLEANLVTQQLPALQFWEPPSPFIASFSNLECHALPRGPRLIYQESPFPSCKYDKVLTSQRQYVAKDNRTCNAHFCAESFLVQSSTKVMMAPGHQVKHYTNNVCKCNNVCIEAAMLELCSSLNWPHQHRANPMYHFPPRTLQICGKQMHL